MLKVGITGGMGSGKSTVCKIFETLGIPVFYADDEAKKILNEDEELKKNIQSVFGKEIYTGGILNRSALAQIVFNDKSKLEKLNSWVHPATKKKYEAWENAHSSIPYSLHEAAILFEAGVAERMDKVITVAAPEQLRIERIIKRDGVTPENITARMNNQWTEEQRNSKADYIIYNDENRLVIPQVLKIHNELLQIAGGMPETSW